MGIINNFINSLKDNFTMAEFNISGRMTVKSLRKQFKDAFGATLRVYKGKQYAPEDATLASIRSSEGAKGGDFTCKGNLLVNNFESKMQEIFGITVKVANSDNTKLSDGKITIAAAGREAVKTDDWSNEQIQCYFWDKLQELLAAKGYTFEKKDFAKDVEDYYKSTRYKRYGVTFNIYRTKKGQDVTFSVIATEKYWYGIKYGKGAVKDKALEDAVNGVDASFLYDSANWAAWAYSSKRHELNFKKMDSEGIGKLRNPSARGGFMGGVANEIDGLVKKFVEAFKKKGL